MKNSRTKIYSNSITYERKKVEEFNKKCYDINEINKDDNINLYFNVLFNHWFHLFIRIFLHQNFPLFTCDASLFSSSFSTASS